MTDLSPAAEAVLHAVTLKQYDVPYYACPASIDQIKSDAAAVLRAAADQVVPACQSIDRADGSLRQGDILWDDATASICRRKLLAIAAELEQS
jgi:hypothetical protein